MWGRRRLARACSTSKDSVAAREDRQIDAGQIDRWRGKRSRIEWAGEGNDDLGEDADLICSAVLVLETTSTDD